MARRAGDHLEQPMSHDLAEAFQREGPDGLRRHGVSNQVERRLAQQDLADPCGLLQPGGEVHRSPDHEGLAARRVGRDDLTGVDADPCVQPHAPCGVELGIQGFEQHPASPSRPARRAPRRPRGVWGCRRPRRPRRR